MRAAEEETCCLAAVSTRTVTEVKRFDKTLYNLQRCPHYFRSALLLATLEVRLQLKVSISGQRITSFDRYLV